MTMATTGTRIVVMERVIDEVMDDGSTEPERVDVLATQPCIRASRLSLDDRCHAERRGELPADYIAIYREHNEPDTRGERNIATVGDLALGERAAVQLAAGFQWFYLARVH
jgi:hypothetical protein